MATPDEAEVKDVGVSYVEPAGDDAENVEPEQTDPDSSPEETPEAGTEEAPASPAAHIDTPEPQPATPGNGKSPDDEDLAVLPDETLRERALRIELKKTRAKLRGQRTDEIIGPAPRPSAQPAALDETDQAVVSKYKPEELSALREVFPVLAKEMGFVRKDELAVNSYASEAQAQLDTFLEKHPEYLPENDPDGTLWEAFKGEYQLYNKPTNPKDFAKIFERVHQHTYGIQPSGPLPKVAAAREKVTAASHTGKPPTTTPSLREHRGAHAAGGLRLDMLKGFNDSEIDDIAGG